MYAELDAARHADKRHLLDFCFLTGYLFCQGDKDRKKKAREVHF